MNRRLRFLGALLALLALFVYAGESAWVSTCPPGAETHAGLERDLPAPGAHARTAHGSPPASSDAAPSNADAPACPFGMTAAGGSCVAVSLPTVGAPLTQMGETCATLPLLRDSAPEHLAAAFHFRPPRA